MNTDTGICLSSMHNFIEEALYTIAIDIHISLHWTLFYFFSPILFYMLCIYCSSMIIGVFCDLARIQ